MPELPAMENFRRSIEHHCLGKKVIDVQIKKDRVVQFTETKLKAVAIGNKVSETTRHGKYVFVRIGATSKTVWLAFHCGMTGYFTYPDPVTAEKKIDKAKIVLKFSNDSALAFYDPRRFGRVELITNPDDFIAKHKLGVDAETIKEIEFKELVQTSGKSLKAFFLDQSIIAGIGNVYGDEIPFHAKLNPKRSGKDLTKAETSRLHKSFVKVLKTAIDRKAYLDHWDMLPKRWLVHARETGAPCPHCSQAVNAYKAGGRDGYFCPGCQL